MIALRIRTVLGLTVLMNVLSVHSSLATAISLDNNWVKIEDTMTLGTNPFFTGTGTGADANGKGIWSWDSPTAAVSFDVTDWAIATDRYTLYLDGVALVAPGLQAGVPYTSIPRCVDPVTPACHFTLDPSVAFGDSVFAQQHFVFAAGAHTISIEDTLIPPQQFPVRGLQRTGTVAFRATPTPVPEPSTLLLLATGLIGGAKTLRRRLRGRA